MPMKARYTVIDGEIIAEKRSGVRSLYVPDSLGSIRGLINSAQTQTDTFSYWPYGEVNTHTGTTDTPFRFGGTQGYYKDSSASSTGRCYVRARYLDLARGRWLIKDPLGFDAGDTNLYRYVNNNPVSAADSSGLLGCSSGGSGDCGPKPTSDCSGEIRPWGPYSSVTLQTDCRKLNSAYWHCICNCCKYALLQYQQIWNRCQACVKNADGDQKKISNCQLRYMYDSQWLYEHSEKACKKGCGQDPSDRRGRGFGIPPI